MTWKKALRAAAALPFRLLPLRLRRRLLQAIAESYASRDPATAMRWLLQADDDVTSLVNDVAVRYDDGLHVKHRLMRYHDFFLERVRPEERVLDIGCGYGAVAFSIASRTSADVVGIDLDRSNFEKARARFRLPNLHFVHGDALVDLPQERFDVIVFSNVLEHLDERAAFLRRVQARLSPDRWLIRVPAIDRDWRVAMRKELGMLYFNDVTHRIEYTRATFEAEMSEASLSIVHLQMNWGEIWAEVRAE